MAHLRPLQDPTLLQSGQSDLGLASADDGVSAHSLTCDAAHIKSEPCSSLEVCPRWASCEIYRHTQSQVFLEAALWSEIRHAQCREVMTQCRVNAFEVQTCPIPASGDEFLRVWKRLCTTCESRLALLKKCGPVRLQSIFKVNLPGELLSEILIALDSRPLLTTEAVQADNASQGCEASQWVPAEADDLHSRDAQLAFDILKALSGEPCKQLSSELAPMLQSWFQRCASASGTGRFALTVRLTTLAAKRAAERLFLSLHLVVSRLPYAMKPCCEELDQLQSAFGVQHRISN